MLPRPGWDLAPPARPGSHIEVNSMFPSRPEVYQCLVDLDHVECPHSGVLGDPDAVRARLKPYGLDIAWNTAIKAFSIIQWSHIKGCLYQMPTIVWNVTDGQTGKSLALSEDMISMVIHLHRHRGTVESRLRAEQEAKRDVVRHRDEAAQVQAEEVVRDIVDTHRDRRETVPVPEMPKRG